MRIVRPLLASTALVAAVPAAAQPATSPDAVDAALHASIESTKTAMMSDPRSALGHARRALALAAKLPASRHARVDAVTARWLHGEALIFLNEPEKALPIIGAALAEAERFAPDTKLHGDLLRARGAIAAQAGKVTLALRDYQRAHDVFQRAGEPRQRALTLQDLGMIYSDAGDHARSLDYYDQSADVYTDDPALTLTMQNNRAENLRRLRRHAEAAVAYRLALAEAKKLDSALLQTRILTNLASAEAEAGRFRSAQAAVDQALALSTHGDAAGWRHFIHGAGAQVAAGQDDMRRAAELLRLTFRGVDVSGTDLQYREYHQTAATVYERLGDVRAALDHAKAFQRLEREAHELIASNAAQLMAARFDFTRQNLEISQLKQDQLKRDVEVERDKSRFRTILFSALLAAGAFIVGVLLFGFIQTRRSRDAVRAANDSLTEVNDRLEKALKAKTEFLATTSHEIRTPLNGILGMTQVMLADRGVEPRLRERIQVVHGAGETMKALVDDILDVAKMESGELVVHREPCGLTAILDDAARLWSGQAQAKGLELVLEADGAPERIVSDGARLRQIVFNLMSNALKFTAAGRVTLFAGVEGDGEAAGEAETLVVRVSDTGIGIPRDKLEEIFEAFRQVDGGTTRQFGGTGLGLAICRQLARKLGGDITADSRLGRGTTFTLRLPLERAEAEAAPTPGEERDRALAEARMLLIERNPVNQGMIRLLLAAEAAAVAVAEDAADAVARLEAGEVDHLLVDAASLVEDDADLLQRLRDLAGAARAAGAHCTVLLAPDAVGISVADVMGVGASQLIVKPIAAPEMIAALRTLHGDEPDPFVAPALLQAA